MRIRGGGFDHEGLNMHLCFILKVASVLLYLRPCNKVHLVDVLQVDDEGSLRLLTGM